MNFVPKKRKIPSTYKSIYIKEDLVKKIDNKFEITKPIAPL